jgi:hypothetical protein
VGENILPKLRRGLPPTLVESGTDLKITSGECLFIIDKKTGLLRGVECAGQKFSFENGPIATTGKPALKSLAHKMNDGVLQVTASFKQGFSQIGWSFCGENGVECNYIYPAEGKLDYSGVTFDYPEGLVRGKKWLGDGPFRVWKNRRAGVTFNVWENKYNNTITGYSGFDYPEFKGCFANVLWLQLDTEEGPITIVPGNSSTFVQVLTPEFPPRELEGETKVNLPRCGIALLDAIPPVGSKFKTAATTGPHGQQSEAFDGYSTGSVKFYFGELPTTPDP